MEDFQFGTDDFTIEAWIYFLVMTTLLFQDLVIQISKLSVMEWFICLIGIKQYAEFI